MAYYPTYMQQGYGQQNYGQQSYMLGFVPPQGAQTQSAGGFHVRPVTSRAEVEVAQIPFDGSSSWFYDTSTDKMYSKTFNPNDGTAPIATYVREVPAPPVQYATVEDINALREEIERLKKPARKAVKNDDADE